MGRRPCSSIAGTCLVLLVLLLGGCLRSGFDLAGDARPLVDTAPTDGVSADHSLDGSLEDAGTDDAGPGDGPGADVFKGQGYAQTLAGGQGGEGLLNGPAATALFSHPHDAVVTAGGVVYVADTGNGLIRKIESGVVSTVAPGTYFKSPVGLGLDGAGRLYVSENSGHRIMVVDKGAVSLVAGTGTAGSKDGSASSAQLDSPEGIFVTAAGIVYVADWGNHTIRKIESGVVSTLAGSGSPGFKDGPAATAQFQAPHDLCLDAAGTTLYVTDYEDHRIRAVKGGTVSTVAGSGVEGFKDGPAPAAQFENPTGLAVGANGELYVAEEGHRIRRIQGGTVSTLSGTGVPGHVDGPGATAQFNVPESLELHAGILYVTEWFGHRIRLVYP